MDFSPVRPTCTEHSQIPEGIRAARQGHLALSQPHPAWPRTLPGIQGQPGGAGDVPGCSSAFLPHPDPGIPRCLPQVCFPKASSRRHLAPESRRSLFLGRQRGRQSRHVVGIALPDPGVAFGVSRSAFQDSGSLRLCRLLFYPSEQSPGFPGTRSRRFLGFGAPLWPWQGGTVDIPVGYSQPLFWLPAFGGFSRSRALFQPRFPAGFRFPAPCERRQRAPCQVLRSAACFKMEAGRNPFSWRRCRPFGIRDSGFSLPGHLESGARQREPTPPEARNSLHPPGPAWGDLGSRFPPKREESSRYSRQIAGGCARLGKTGNKRELRRRITGIIPREGGGCSPPGVCTPCWWSRAAPGFEGSLAISYPGIWL